MKRRVGGQPHKTPYLHPQHRDPPPRVIIPRRAWVRLNRLRTGVGRFRSCLYKLDMASSAACECGTEEQTVDHIVLQCLIHRPPHGLHGLTFLDDDKSNVCSTPAPRSSAANQWLEQLAQKKKSEG